MFKHHAGVLLLTALAFLAAPGAALAQDEADPPVLRLSYFMCDLSGGNGDAIEEEIETRDMPIWNALVEEGRIESYGYFFHWWADEWNVGIYTIAPTIQAIIDATEESGNRLEAQYGENAPSVMATACPHHRDGFYTLGPTTDDAPAAGGR